MDRSKTRGSVKNTFLKRLARFVVFKYSPEIKKSCDIRIISITDLFIVHLFY